MTGSSIRVVLADDNRTVRAGIRRLLSSVPDIELVGEAGDGREALRLVAEAKPDVLLLDVEMPELDGIAVTRRLKDAGQVNTRILILSAHNDREYIRAVLLNGASGYLLKDEAPEKIITALRKVANGIHPLPKLGR